LRGLHEVFVDSFWPVFESQAEEAIILANEIIRKHDEDCAHFKYVSHSVRLYKTMRRLEKGNYLAHWHALGYSLSSSRVILIRTLLEPAVNWLSIYYRNIMIFWKYVTEGSAALSCRGAELPQ
jgi:hypothetical protein